MRTLKPLRDPAFDAGCWPSGPSDLRIGGGWAALAGKIRAYSDFGNRRLGPESETDWEEHFLLVTRHNNNNKPITNNLGGPELQKCFARVCIVYVLFPRGGQQV